MNARLITLLLLWVAPPVHAATETDVNLDVFSKDLAQFQRIREDVALPEHLLKPNAKRNGEELNLKKYFEVFDTLRLHPDKSLDWVYSSSDLGGRPLLYLRDKTQKPFETLAKLKNAVREEAGLEQVEIIWDEYAAASRRLTEKFGDDPLASNREADAGREKLDKDIDRSLARYPRREYWKWWREGVVPDGSAHSFLELAALFLLADQFALRWHSRFNDLEILPTKAAIDERLARHYWEWEGEKVFIPDDVAAKARELNPTSRVRFADKTVEVTLLTFTKWGGFQRKTLVVSKTAPHVVKSETDKTEVEWDCGITY